MPCPHNEISIVQRSHRQSAVAAAAYQSGEKLFCEYDQEVKHYPEKRGIVHNEILLPANAPLEYTDRNTLWNAAEAVEKQWNSQLARRWVLSIPREIPPDQYAALGGDADDAESGLIRERRHGNERQAAVRGARRDGAGDGVFGVGLDGGGEG